MLNPDIGRVIFSYFIKQIKNMKRICPNIVADGKYVIPVDLTTSDYVNRSKALRLVCKAFSRSYGPKDIYSNVGGSLFSKQYSWLIRVNYLLSKPYLINFTGLKYLKNLFVNGIQFLNYLNVNIDSDQDSCFDLKVELISKPYLMLDNLYIKSRIDPLIDVVVNHMCNRCYGRGCSVEKTLRFISVTKKRYYAYFR